jgi:hypothetical protein
MSTSINGGLVGRAIQLVASVFAAFGGFLANIQPPQQAYRGFSVAFAAVLATLALLLLSALGRKWAKSTIYNGLCLAFGVVLIVGVAVAGVRYQDLTLMRTVDVGSGAKPQRMVIGTQLTGAAAEWINQNPCSIQNPYSCSTQRLLTHFGTDSIDLVWTKDSILESVKILNDVYLTFAVLLSSSVFVLGECVGEHFLRNE